LLLTAVMASYIPLARGNPAAWHTNLICQQCFGSSWLRHHCNPKSNEVQRFQWGTMRLE
jgi:hypothetical protein